MENKNIALFLPRPKPDHYRGGMPLGCEEVLIRTATKILFPEAPVSMEPAVRLLNLFCGMNKFGIRVDLNPKVNPNYLLDAHSCSKEILSKQGKFEIILADPPYSDAEAEKLYKEGYGVTLPKLDYKVWTYECEKLLAPNGILIVYHKYIMPNPNWARFEVVKRVFVGTRVYHVPRVAIYFQSKY